MLSHLTLANSTPMIILCAIAILVVLFQPIVLGKLAWKRGKEIGLTTEEMKKSAKSSAIFSIIPSLPIIISYLLLVPALGRFFPWLRLSVVGSAAYETMVADMAATGMGYESIFTANMTNDAFIMMMIIVTIGILGGNIFNLFFLRSYDKKVREIKNKNSAMVPVITTAMFLGMYGTMSAPHLTNFQSPLSISSMIVAGLCSLVLLKLSAKHPKLKEFAFSISMIGGMLSASVLSLFIK